VEEIVEILVRDGVQMGREKGGGIVEILVRDGVEMEDQT
jgi:hypothetical protein